MIKSLLHFILQIEIFSLNIRFILACKQSRDFEYWEILTHVYNALHGLKMQMSKGQRFAWFLSFTHILTYYILTAFLQLHKHHALSD